MKLRKILAAIIVIGFSVVGFNAAQAGGSNFTPKQYNELNAASWTGLYAGINGANQITGLTETENHWWGTKVRFVEDNSFIGGFHIGYDHQIGKFVLGIRGEYNWVIENGDIIHGQDSWNVIGRAGFLLGRNTLFYGLGGFTGVNNEGMPDLEGGLVGVGLEHRLFSNIHVSAEWQRLVEQDEGNLSFDTDYIRLGVSLRFNK